VETFVRGDARAIEGLFAALGGLDPESADRLWALIGELGPDEIGRALDSLSRLSPGAARRLVSLADQPVLQKLIGGR
jgi:ubiquinone biosynthesis protein UbiJ